jgi:hypothetical protein
MRVTSGMSALAQCALERRDRTVLEGEPVLDLRSQLLRGTQGAQLARLGHDERESKAHY